MNGYYTGGSAVLERLGIALMLRQQVTGNWGSPHTFGKRGTMIDSTSTTLTRRIGSTTYKVNVYFQESGNQTITDKILHMIQNECLAIKPICGTMDMPQVSRQSERGA